MSTPAASATLPPVGLHTGIKYHQYDAWPAMRHSVLRLFKRTPAHARAALERPAPPSDAQMLGQAIHRAVLEPESFAAEYVRAPKVNRSTTIGKHRWSTFVAEHVDKKVLDFDEYATCLGARESLLAHSTARQLLEGDDGKNEVSALWHDPGTGIPCKARLDRLAPLHGGSVVVDLKSGLDASSRAFERAIFQYDYAHQAGFYLDGCDALTPADEKRERKYVFLVVETKPPYCVAVYELDQEAIDLGRAEYQAHLTKYARCVSSGEWPGYDAGIGTISLPRWAFGFHGEQS